MATCIVYARYVLAVLELFLTVTVLSIFFHGMTVFIVKLDGFTVSGYPIRAPLISLLVQFDGEDANRYIFFGGSVWKNICQLKQVKLN